MPPCVQLLHLTDQKTPHVPLRLRSLSTTLRPLGNRTLGAANPEPAVLDGLDRATDALRGLGHRVTDDDTDLPAGLQLRQLIAPHHRDDHLLAVAATLEDKNKIVKPAVATAELYFTTQAW